MIQLLVVLWSLYLSECLLRLRRGSVLLHAPFARSFRLRSGESLPQIGGHGMGMLQPLPPFGWAFEVATWPISLNPQGVASRPASEPHQRGYREHLGRHLSFEEIESIEYEEHRVRLNGDVFASCSDAIHAQTLARVLRELKDLDGSAREVRIRQILRERLSPEGVLETTDRVRVHLQWLLILENTLFLLLILLLPLALYLFGAGIWTLSVLTATVVVWIGTLLAFATAHAELRAQGLPSRAWSIFQMICLAPGTIRGHFLLARAAFRDREPAPVIACLLEGDVWAAELGRIRRDLRWPIPAPDDEDPEVESVVGWHRARYLEAVDEVMASVDRESVEDEEPPEDLSGQGSAWCPRCRTVYQRAEGGCPDCGGCALVQQGW